MKRLFLLTLLAVLLCSSVPASAIGPFTDNGNNTVTDQATGRPGSSRPEILIMTAL